MTRRGIGSCALAISVLSGCLLGCSSRGCAPSAPVSVAPPPAVPPLPVEEYEISIRERRDRLAFELRAVSGRQLGEWTVSARPTPAELAPVARAVPATPSGVRRVTVRATDGIRYAVIVALLDACHENGVSDVAIGPPPAL